MNLIYIDCFFKAVQNGKEYDRVPSGSDQRLGSRIGESLGTYSRETTFSIQGIPFSALDRRV